MTGNQFDYLTVLLSLTHGFDCAKLHLGLILILLSLQPHRQAFYIAFLKFRESPSDPNVAAVFLSIAESAELSFLFSVQKFSSRAKGADRKEGGGRVREQPSGEL